MHERRLVEALWEAACRTTPEPSSIRSLTVRVGCLAGVDETYLRTELRHLAENTSGTSPEIVVDRDPDPVAPGALDVRLTAVRVTS